MLVASPTSTSTRPLTDPPTVRLSRREIERRIKKLRSLGLSRDGVSVENLSSSGYVCGPCAVPEKSMQHLPHRMGEIQPIACVGGILDEPLAGRLGSLSMNNPPTALVGFWPHRVRLCWLSPKSSSFVPSCSSQPAFLEEFKTLKNSVEEITRRPQPYGSNNRLSLLQLPHFSCRLTRVYSF